MAQYYTDFSEYTTGSQPSDWTKRWVTANSTFSVESDSGATGGKILQASRASSTDRSALSWDAVEESATMEVLARVRFVGSKQTTSTIGGTLGRGSGSSGSETAMANNPLAINSGSERYNLTQYSNGSFSILSFDSVSWDTSTWYWAKLALDASSAESKRWSGSPSDEPSSGVSASTTVTGSGWAGVLIFQHARFLDFDVFAVGTDGDPAPTGPLSTTEAFALRHNPRTNKVIPVLSAPTVTDIGANCVRPRVTKGY